jgi:hypothetical protein
MLPGVWERQRLSAGRTAYLTDDMPNRKNSSSHARWLWRLARTVIGELRDAKVAHLALRQSPVVGEARADGWYVTLATLIPGGGTIAIFLDRTSGGTPRRVWFGTWGRDLHRSQMIERSMRRSYGPTVVSRLESDLTNRQLRRPVREPGGGKYGHYLGLYIAKPPDPTRAPTKRQVARIKEFCELVDGALGSTRSRVVGSIGDGKRKQRMGRAMIEPRGWLFALSNAANSNWKSVDDFFARLEDSVDDDGASLISKFRGKTLRKGMSLRPGDGIALYHTTRAAFPKPDPYKRRPRVSLIGEVLHVKQDGQHVTDLEMRFARDDIWHMRTRPVVRNANTEHIFRASGMVDGAIATFYPVPPGAWRRLVSASRSGSYGPSESRARSPKGFSSDQPRRVTSEVTRIVRDSAQAQQLKRMYRDQCQICGRALEIRLGHTYSEVHHVRPLGGKHRGPDVESNMMVVCPNHHALLDLGAVRFVNSSAVDIASEEFSLTRRHAIDAQHIRYNNKLHARSR